MASVTVMSRFAAVSRMRLLATRTGGSSTIHNKARTFATSGSGNDDDGNKNEDADGKVATAASTPKAAAAADEAKKSEASKAAKEKLNQLLGNIRDKNQEKQKEAKKGGKVSLRGVPKLTNLKAKAVKVKGLEPEMVHAVHRVANAVSTGEKDDDVRQVKIRKTESALLGKLMRVAKESDEAREESEVSGAGGSSSNLSSLLQNMKVNTKVTQESDSQSQQHHMKMEMKKNLLTEEQMKFLEERKRLRHEKRRQMNVAERTPLDLFNGRPPLGIFDKNDFKDVEPKVVLETWQKSLDRELRIKATLPPRNLLEDMANMTEKGVLWHFPIDNEQGIEAEGELEPFHQHVFLEHHLEPWCPAKGPLRHFMELVCVGLSKNSHISAAKKTEHIQWYRDYFEKPEHKDILKASGAYE